ncbi:MAG: peroxiredoxin [Pseudomonadota bacterium]
MSHAQPGQIAPDFTALATGGMPLSLSSLRGAPVVLYFYPKDNTPGCTNEARDFAQRQAQFKQAGAHLIGVSRDSIRTHENFRAKHELPFPLISDPEGTLCTLYGVLKPKKLYGRDYVGIERTTLLIDARGVIRERWEKVRVPGHADTVLQAVLALAPPR